MRKIKRKRTMNTLMSVALNRSLDSGTTTVN